MKTKQKPITLRELIIYAMDYDLKPTLDTIVLNLITEVSAVLFPKKEQNEIYEFLISEMELQNIDILKTIGHYREVL